MTEAIHNEVHVMTRISGDADGYGNLQFYKTLWPAVSEDYRRREIQSRSFTWGSQDLAGAKF